MSKIKGQNVVFTTSGGVQLFDADASNYIILKAPNVLAVNNTYILPDAYPTTGQVLSGTDTGVLSWIDAGGGGGITWSTPVDANVVPDGDGSRDLGSSAAQFNSIHAYVIESAADLYFQAGDNTGIESNGAGLVRINFGTASATSISFKADNSIQLAASAGPLDMNTAQIINVTDPTNAQDAATKAYVDGTLGASQWTTTGSDIYYTTGKVGIGTAIPGVALEVSGGTDTAIKATMTLGAPGLANVFVIDSDQNTAFTIRNSVATSGLIIGNTGGPTINFQIANLETGGTLVFYNNGGNRLVFENDGEITFHANSYIDANGAQVKNLPPPVDTDDATSKTYVDGKFTPFVVFASAASDPGSPVAGAVYFNTGSGKLKVYNGAAWQTISSS